MKGYVRPQIERQGTLEAITKQAKTGNMLDIAFAAGTPLSEITLS